MLAMLLLQNHVLTPLSLIHTGSLNIGAENGSESNSCLVKYLTSHHALNFQVAEHRLHRELGCSDL